MEKIGLGYYEYTARIKELGKRRIEISKVRDHLLRFKLGSNKGLYVSM